MDQVFKYVLKMNNTNSNILKKVYHLWLRVIYSCDIMPGTKIGGDTEFFHKGLGVVINQSAVIGANCKFHKGVVVGKNVVIGDNVLLGANSVILGPVVIGHNAKIGAGTVVTHNVPEGTTVIGNPAIILKKNVISSGSEKVLK